MNDEEQTPASGATSSTTPARDAAGAPQIDVQALADRVYRLMVADLRVTIARGAVTGTSER